MSSSSAFLQFWWTDKTRNNFLSCLPKEDLSSLRLACHDFGVRAAPLLFNDLAITFRPSTFTKPARMAALDRIGHHVRTLTFNMPHGPETFLPPLLDCVTGEEVTFTYQPYIQPKRSSFSRLSAPTYGSWEMTDLLVKQYPPLFHAAANVSSFVRAFSAIPNLSHLKISCPDQEAAHRFRRSTVDYALISLRIAVERSPLPHLDTLSLLPIHPGAVLYLTPTMGFGARPNSQKRWRQIRKLNIRMDALPSVPSSRPTTPTAVGQGTITMNNDHLKLLHSYLTTFSPTLTHFSFCWLSQTSPPSPISIPTSALPKQAPPPLYPTPPTTPTSSTFSPSKLPFTPPSSTSTSPLSASPSSSTYHTAPSSTHTPPPTPISPHRGPFPLSLTTEPSLLTPSPPLACPRRCHLTLPPLKFPRLVLMHCENAALDATQVATFITAHAKTIADFNFEKCDLRSGDWDEALKPLTRICGSERWRGEEVPFMLGDEQELGGEKGRGGESEGEVEGEGEGEGIEVPVMLREEIEEGIGEVEVGRGLVARRMKACPVGGWGKMGRTGRGLLFGTEEHMRRLLRGRVWMWA
ncbi:hypothetical protein MMC30_003132 [Trapelia coarctata]|nr:hypothetical protein [Trapelia coarctata]